MTATLTQPVTQTETINGVNMAALRKVLADVQRDPANGMTRWGAATRWVQGGVSETHVTGCDIGHKRVKKDFKFRIDEPLELGGSNAHSNPQEYLLGALNACMVIGYVALSSLQGITLESLEIESSGEIDLRGFLGLSKDVKPGYDRIHYTVRIKGDGTAKQFEQIHKTVIATSPNRFNLTNPIAITSELLVK